MKTTRADHFFYTVLALGIGVFLFPSIVFYPASSFWETVTGKMDLFEVRAIGTWLVALLIAALVSAGRSLFLMRFEQPATGAARKAFHLLALIMVGATCFSIWRPFTAIGLFPW
jgi:hypothetical protein